ncbi:MAG TPA: cupin domain-containing protein [Acidobacteriaceae bacterium]|nr:cupin domain-containing protein [Acidobacteriaceae bacterium]
MPTKIASRETAEHYTWGGPHATDCDAWHLLKTPDLSIIEELMPPGTPERPIQEQRHVHARSRQFFFVLEGELSLEVDHQVYPLQAGQGLEVAPGQPHQAINRSSHPVRFLVTSQPPSHGDRVPA